jgi:hypothetical protein
MNVLSLFKNSPKPVLHQPDAGIHNEQPDGAITWQGGGWEPAGYDLSGNYVVLSRKTGQLMTLRSQDLEDKKLVLMLGPRILDDYQVVNPKTKAKEFSKDDLITSVRRACDDMGLFDNARVRGPGLYRKGDDLVINFGDQVANSEGNPVHTAPELTGAAYQSGQDLGFSMQTPLASEEDVNTLVQAMNSFGLRRSGDAKLLLLIRPLSIEI